MKLHLSRCSFLGCLLAASFSLTSNAAQHPKKLLVVTVTTGFRHSSISTAEKVLTKLADETKMFTVDFVQQPPNEPQAPKKPTAPKTGTPEELAAFKTAEAAFEKSQKEFETKHAAWVALQKEGLKKLSATGLRSYDGVVFANTTGDLPLPNNQAFIDWISSGKGFIGMHSASDTFHGFRPYISMLGAEFLTHGAQATVDCLNQNPKHPACAHLGGQWTVHDEIYLMKSFERGRVSGLLSLDKHPNTKAPGDFPVAWCREFGKGKIFYTSLGHREDVWENPVYQKHILGGIEWALGLSKVRVTHAE